MAFYTECSLFILTKENHIRNIRKYKELEIKSLNGLLSSFHSKYIMRPITFTCHALLPLDANAISAQIADLSRWPEFTGYGRLPGIESATYEIRTPNMVGSRILVRNTDGSGHVEEILHWEPDSHIHMKLHEFTPPLNRLASHFLETWTFTATPTGTQVSRQMELFAKNGFTRPILWLISNMLKRAIDAHLTQLAQAHEAS